MKFIRSMVMFLFFFSEVYLFAFKPTSMSIVNYPDLVVPPEPILVIDISYEAGSNSNQEDEDHVFIVVSNSKFSKKYEIGEDIPFQILGSGKIRVFLPLEKRLSKSNSFSLSVVEGNKVLLSTNLSLILNEEMKQKPILLAGKENYVTLPKSGKLDQKIFFISLRELMPKAIVGDNEYKLSVYRDNNFKILKYVRFVFTNTGLFKFVFDGEEIVFNVEEDKNPPKFELLIPSNNALFFNTNIVIKWTKPLDESGINFEKSYLKVEGNNGFTTNISPLVPLNRESLIGNYNVARFCLPTGVYNLEIRYFDNSENLGIVKSKFSIVDKYEDKEKPAITKFYIEGITKAGEIFISDKTNVVLFIEASDGIYGSGISKVYYFLNGNSYLEPMTGNIRYINLELDKSTNYLSFFVEDENSNFSETNTITIVAKK
ncbi:MAG: hypothetical protein ACP5QP_03920 [Brevinematia bacterium]